MEKILGTGMNIKFIILDRFRGVDCLIMEI